MWNRFLPNLIAYLQYLKQRWFLLTFSYILQSLNQQTTLLSSLLESVFLSTSLYIHFSPILSITCLNKQTKKQHNTTKCEQDNSTSNFQRHSVASVRNTLL